MTDAGLRYSELPVAHLRAVKRDATGRLLGDTIGIGDEDWQTPSLLPGWTRAHVATHLSRGADALAGLVRATLAGEPRPLYAQDVDEQLERGSERTGLELQIDLDTAASNLYRAFDTVPEGAWATPVPGRQPLTLTDLVVARISEVELHRVDLNCGRTVDEIDDAVAHWLIDLRLRRLNAVPVPHPAWLATTSGERFQLGEAPTATVSGPSQALLAWLTGRATGQAFNDGGVPAPVSR